MNIVIPYKPRGWAQRFHESRKRFLALVLHRRAGKTTALVNHLQRSALDDQWESDRIKHLYPTVTNSGLKELLRGRVYGLILPTYKQAKYVAWDMLKYYSKDIPGAKPNESLIMSYPNGSKICLFGADNPDSLRGIPLWGVGFDEYSQHPANIFSEVISKSLADHLGYAIFSGTIKGKNQLFRAYEVASKNPEEWFSLWQDIDESLRSESGPTIDLLRMAIEDDRKLVAQGMMTQDEFDQEWYLSPTAAIRGAIYGREITRARQDGRIGVVPYDTSCKVYTVWDLGKGPNMAVGFYQNNFGQVRKIDYWEGSGNEGLPEAIREVLRKPYVYGKHFAPHDIKATDISTGVTRKQTASKLGIDFEEVPDIGIENGINAAKLLFSRLFIDEKKCAFWLDAVSQYRYDYDEQRATFRLQPLHDWTSHGADELRYAAVIEGQMIDDRDIPAREHSVPNVDPYARQ